MPTITIEELKALCEEMIEEGHGKKEIFISGDDEGNSYHRLFYGFMTEENNIRICIENGFDSWEKDIDPKGIIILG